MEAVFPGSFDPLTLGHYDVILRALSLFDKLYIAIGINTTKPRFFPSEDSLKMIKATFQDQPKIEVISYNELTVDLCKKLDVKHIIRGIRNVGDFEYERSIAEMNQKLNPDVETIFLYTKPEYACISSTIIRELLKIGTDIKDFVPKGTLPYIKL